MNTQLDELEDDAQAFQIEMKKSQTFFRVGMMILPFYQWANNVDKLKMDKAHFQNIHNTIMTELHPKPNWAGLFLMHKSLQNDLIGKEGGRFCYRPGFMVLLNVKEIHKV